VARLALVLCAGLCIARGAAAAQGDRELQVEAAFLVNFIRYTDWPAARMGPPGSPYIVSVVGSVPDVDVIADVASAAGQVGGRRILVRRVDPNTLRGSHPADARPLLQSHVVFVLDESRIPCRTIRRLLDGASVLTVGDAPGFATEGGMLGLVRIERHLAFEANPAAIRASRLAVSAKVLKLARIRGGPP
jgi:hypothetical protein